MIKHGTVSPFSLVKFEDIVNSFDINKPVFWDMESFNATKHYEGGFYGSVRLAQFMQEGWDRSLIVDFRYLSPKALPLLYKMVMEYTVIGQNLAYDFGLLQEDLTRQYPDQKWELYNKDVTTYHDTLLYIRDLFPLQKSYIFQGRYSLDDSYESILGYNPYNQLGIDKKKMQKASWRYEIGDKQMEYASTDVFHMPYLWNKILEQENDTLLDMTKQQVENYYIRKKISHEAVLIGLAMQDTGLTVGADETADYIAKYDEVKNKAWGELVSYGVLDYKTEFNPASSKQVANWLQLPSSSKEMLKRVQHLPFTDYLIALAGDDEKALRKIINSRTSQEAKAIATEKLEVKLSKRPVLTESQYLTIQTRVQSVMDWRSGNNRANSARKAGMLCMDNPDGRIHGHFTPTTTTGRFSSSQENMQNQPRDSKGIYKAPEGVNYIGFDFAQIEIRTMCALTGEEAMYKVFKEGGDIHQNTQDMCGITKRVVAKNVNFGNLYGMGIPTFQDILLLNDVMITRDKLKEIKYQFLGTYPRVKESHERGIENSKANIPNYSILGHPYFSKYFSQMNNMWNQASGTSEVLKLALSLYKEYNLIKSDNIEINLNVHDAVLFEYKGLPEYITHYTYVVGLLAQKAWFMALTMGYKGGYCKYFDVPMPIEVSHAKIWKDTDKDNPDIKIEGLYYLEHIEEAEKWLSDFKLLHASLQID